MYIYPWLISITISITTVDNVKYELIYLIITLERNMTQYKKNIPVYIQIYAL